MKQNLGKAALLSLPNALTFTNLFAGFFSIVLAANGHIEKAGWLILLALVLDSLDGNIARIFKNPTPFGRELDSLADIVSFVVAPVFLALTLLEPLFSPWNVVFFFIYLGAGAARLARFNLEGTQVKGYFRGLPAPAAALTLAMLILASVKNQWYDAALFSVSLQAVLALLGCLMYSPVLYPKLSVLSFEKWKKFYYVCLAVFFVMTYAVNVETALLLVFALYTILSPTVGHMISPVSYPIEPKAEAPDSTEE